MEAEFQEIDSNGAWGRLYQDIRSECSNYDYTYKEAKKSENKNLNRYRDVSPYDHSRVKLVCGTCDYINANLVEVPAARRAYILAQGPLPNTTGHFWQMVWEQNSKAVLMLNKVIEKNQLKCHQYWPLGSRKDGKEEMVFNDVGLKVEYVSEEEKSFFTIRKLRLTELKSEESRIVQHFHYTTWPDFGVPQSPANFLTFLLAVRKAGVLEENVGPPVVHCSAGIGRSGTFCLVDSCLVLIEQSRDINSVNIKEILLDMRRYRMGLIQTPDQLRFSYLAIIEGAKHVINGTFNENMLMNEENDKSSESILDSRSSYEFVSPPPPLPPRRPRDFDNEVEALRAGENRPTNHVLPTYQNQDDLHNSLDNALDEVEVRKRARRERLTKTAERVELMKRRQQESEAWQKRRSFLQPLSIGLLILLGLGSGILVYKFYYKA